MSGRSQGGAGGGRTVDGARVAELEALIRRYQASYYNGEGEISDAEFDALWDELAALAPDSPVLAAVGADAVDGFPKARHLIPMGSQDKAANPEEFRAWAAKTAAVEYLVQHKLDGAGLELQYQSGRLLRAVTRGDGLVGDDITPNARRMAGVLDALDLPFTGGVRGEVVMPRSVWKAKYVNKANCRNAANGLMRRKDGSGSEDLRLVCYDAAAEGDDEYFPSEGAKLAWLSERGFEITEAAVFMDAEDIIRHREKVASAREGLPYDIDGLVVKDAETDMADLRRARPERQIAFKFQLETAVSVLLSVEWSESGSTYTPIGIIEPVRLAGTTVKRANLNNPGMIRALGLKLGCSVVVVKRGEIIPKIEGRADGGAIAGDVGDVPETGGFRDIDMPGTCGTCASPLIDADTRLYCPNPACPKRLHHRIEKWISVLDIREFGEKLLQRLYHSGRLERVADLYSLALQDFLELERMGELSAAKVLRHLRRERVLPLAAFVAGFDLEGVGETIMEKVTAAGFDTLEALRGASAVEIAAVHGLGEITARTIVEGLAETREDMDAVLAAGVVSIAPPVAAESQPLRGLSFCFTGELTVMKRSAAEERIKALGALVKSSVVKDLSFLVTNDPHSGSGKSKKARELGIPVLDEDAFLAVLADPAAAAERVREPAKAILQSELFGGEAGGWRS